MPNNALGVFHARHRIRLTERNTSQTIERIVYLLMQSGEYSNNFDYFTYSASRKQQHGDQTAR